jgi:hypothetical protein
MASNPGKDPKRVRSGRLGALSVHARGRTNTGPARTAWEAKLAAEAGITEDVSPGERERRYKYALRARMIRLNAARWGDRRAPSSPRAAARTSDASRASANG